MRRTMPTRPLWPMKNSQSARLAALAIAFTRRAICDSDHPNTFSLPSTPAGRMAFRASMAAGVMATTVPWASASVLERTTVTPPLASSQRCTSPQVSRRLRAAQAGVGQRHHQGHVKLPPLSRLIRRLCAAAAPSGLDGGEGAGLPLGPR